MEELARVEGRVRVFLAHLSSGASLATVRGGRCVIKTGIGAMSAALGGLDSLVFAGGVSENSPEVRRCVCEGLGYLGIDLDNGRNTVGERLISTDANPVRVRVIQTDE
jgi:acetate kinase